MPKDGPVLTRTRSLRSPLVVRWLVWNSNFHAEHHAWPGIQWHSFHGIWSGRTDCDTTSALVGTGVASTTSITAPHTFELFMTSSSVCERRSGRPRSGARSARDAGARRMTQRSA